jgi:hypothetical protein
MVKTTDLIERKILSVTKVVCNECDAECTNTYTTFKVRHSFSDNDEEYKQVCFKCYLDKYKEEVNNNKNKQHEHNMKHYMETKK